MRMREREEEEDEEGIDSPVLSGNCSVKMVFGNGAVVTRGLSRTLV